MHTTTNAPFTVIHGVAIHLNGLGVNTRNESANVLAIKPDFGSAYIVLCHVGGYEPYTTHVAVIAADGKWDLYAGHYFASLDDAAADFADRD